MPSKYDRAHIDLSSRASARPFTSPNRDRGGRPVDRDRGQHGRALRGQLVEAIRAFGRERPLDDRIANEGTFVEFELRPGTDGQDFGRKNPRIVPAIIRTNENGQGQEISRTVTLYVEQGAEHVLDQIIEQYQEGPETQSGNPPQAKYGKVDQIRSARFSTFFNDDPARLPTDEASPVWWEAWIAPEYLPDFENLASSLDLRVGDDNHRLWFPDSVIVPILASKLEIELITFSRLVVVELRRLADTPTVFLEADRGEQAEWGRELADKITWPGDEVPAVCIIDTGVNRSHPLIEPALSPTDLAAVDDSWGVADTGGGHGTAMAGLALHGDLTIALQRPGGSLRHRLESVKLLPPQGFEVTARRHYGAITQQAISLPEIERPDRARAYCLATTHDGLRSDRPSAASAALDQAASGSMPGDDGEQGPRRLILVSAGNAPKPIEASEIEHVDAHAVEDPAQAWNALTIGGYTDKILIDDAGYEEHTPFSMAGDLSPHTRTSIAWTGKTPIKPELVFEAGNRAVSPSGKEVIDVDSLGLVSTGPDEGLIPLVPFRETSAATAQASGFAARLMAAHPSYWPETIRALMVHSAEWTEPMVAAFSDAQGKTATAKLLRRYGYGVPNYDRAAQSASNDVALIAQRTIQPFQKTPAKGSNEWNVFDLPWPREALEALGDEIVELKICLSYFIEPNPGMSDKTDVYRYQSYGLRFDLKRRNETPAQFRARLNRDDRGALPFTAVEDDQNDWLFGPNSINAGSVHCDVWRGSAAKLLTRDMLAVFPIGGWWKTRSQREIVEKEARYALIATIRSSNATIDLHTPIETIVETTVPIEQAVEIDR